MKTDHHTITDAGTDYAVQLDIFTMDRVEAIDVYDLPPDLYSSGGWRVEGFINGAPAGTRFYSGNLGSNYWGEESDRVARDFMNDARKAGNLNKGQS